MAAGRRALKQGGRRRLDLKRFSALQGEKGEPGAILTGDVPLEMMKGRKVILSAHPECRHALACHLWLYLKKCFLSDKCLSPVLG
jgi:hypothetical protein